MAELVPVVVVPRGTTEERFDAYKHRTASGCELWTGGTTSDGHAIFAPGQDDERRWVYGHRYALEQVERSCRRACP